LAKKAFVYDGSQWVDIAQSTTDLTNYPTLSGFNYGFRNLVVNGDFKIWQRGTTGVTATNNATGYVADRWQTYRSAYATGINISQQSSIGLTGFNYALRNQRVSGNTSTSSIAIVNNFESENSIPLAGRTVTLSAWIRVGANFSGTLAFGLYSGLGTDQRRASGFTGSITDTVGITPTTSWARYTTTVTLSSTITQTSIWFYWVPADTAGADDWIDITGVQLELGDTATPFEQRPVGTELALCQRYYYRSSAAATSDRLGLWGISHGSSNASLNGIAPVTMRSAPTLSFSSINLWTGGTNVTISSIVAQRSTPTGFGADITISIAGTAGFPFQVTASSSASFWDANAEL
jgi:hypothetical protein